MNAPPLEFLTLPDGRRIAARRRPGRSPTLLFLPGYASDMEGTKALALDAFAAERGVAMLRFDYSGTGSSSGRFEDGTLNRWLEEALAMVDALTEGPLIAVGSSMGGWLALHLALQRPARVVGLIGVAAAPDFTDWGYTTDDKAALVQHGRLERENPYGRDKQVTTRAFWESGEPLRVLGGAINIRCPVRLLHGDADADVPTGVAFKLVEQLRSADVQLTLLKGGNHRLSEPHELRALSREVDDLVELAG
ncbi:alpha/beta fold hydrolase [Sphingomonas arenae]|uniref:alpha/beta fold hydrolase n=1 Tax=Sphingomonas arenae TaxID=2812555 RepID=UPI001967C240|nr:alpha/beta hydrolase [Sphingomonas arenae]